MVQADAGIFTDTFTLLHDTISGNLADPGSRGQKWIFSEFPDPQGRNFPDYPIVTISSAEVNPERVANDTKDYTLTSTIGIHTNSTANLDALAGSILNIFENTEATLEASGLHIDNTLTSGTRTLEVQGQKVRDKNIVQTLRLVSV